MGTIVRSLRREYELRICFEVAPKDSDKDRITLDSEVKRLQALAAERELSLSEQHNLRLFLQHVEEGSSPGVINEILCVTTNGTRAIPLRIPVLGLISEQQEKAIVSKSNVAQPPPAM